MEEYLNKIASLFSSDNKVNQELGYQIAKSLGLSDEDIIRIILNRVNKNIIFYRDDIYTESIYFDLSCLNINLRFVINVLDIGYKTFRISENDSDKWHESDDYLNEQKIIKLLSKKLNDYAID